MIFAGHAAQKSPQGTRRQGEKATGSNTDCCNSEVVGRHHDEIAERRRNLLEHLAET